MENVDLEIWWSSLPVSEKERIARKGLSKAGDPDESKACYPACTVWKQVEIEDALLASETTELLMGSEVPPRKEFIYKHCVLAHRDELREWKEQNPYGD